MPLVNIWDVDNVHSKGIKLTLTPATVSGGSDTLTAEVRISEIDDNVLTLVDNNLYVSGSGITKALSECEILSGNLETLRTTVIGSNGNYTYPQHTNSHIISGTTSYDGAVTTLDEAIYDLIKRRPLLGSETSTTHTEVNEVGDYRQIVVDARLSHGNKIPGMSDSELAITNVDDKYFSDTNVLRYLNITETREHQPLDPDNSYNGLYLSNEWDCGKYYQDSTESAEITEMISEGYEVYREKYKTDESTSASDFNYNNNARL